MKKKTVESSIGIRVLEPVARHIDDVLKSLPKDKRYDYRRKGSVASSVELVGERTEVSKITTSAMDRDFEIVLPQGIDLTQYDLNRIILFGHDQMKPVGKALWVKLEGNGLIAKSVYTQRKEKWVGDWLPDYVWAMVEADVLRGKSIGFLPLEVTDPTDEELAINPSLQQVIRRSLLLEYSVVAVPSNPLALVEAIGKGLTGNHWKMNWTGKNVNHKPKPKPIERRQVEEVLEEINFDHKIITELALKELADRWEV